MKRHLAVGVGLAMRGYDGWKAGSDLEQWYFDYPEEDEEFLESEALIDDILRVTDSIIANRKVNPDGLTMYSIEDALAIAREYMPEESEAFVASVANALWKESGK